MKNNIIEIPFTSFVAYLLLNKREVSFFDISNCISRYNLNCKDDIDVIDDDDNPLYNYVNIESNRFIVRDDIDYDKTIIDKTIINKTIIDGISFRDYLRMLSSFINVTYLNEKKSDISSNNPVKSKRLFLGKGKK